jgi:hypothetical protein
MGIYSPQDKARSRLSNRVDLALSKRLRDEEEEQAIASMLATMLDTVERRLDGRRGTLVMPSLSQLATQFHCSHLDVYDVLQALRNRGYDYQFAGMNGSVHVWHLGE